MAMDSDALRSKLRRYHDDVVMPGGYKHNLPDRLKTTNLYYNSQYKTGPRDEQGFKKFFYNIVKPACDVASKMIDLDTKEIQLIPRGADDEMKVWLMEKRLRLWLDENNFGQTLNDIGLEFPKDGHIVTKTIKGKVKRVPMVNLRVDPTAVKMIESDYVCEVHRMTGKDINAMGWNGEEKPDEGPQLVWECYWKTDKGYDRTIYSDVLRLKNGDDTAENQINNDVEFADGKILHTDTVSKLPYDELKWEEVPGRWLGLGFVEYLEDDQIAQNEAENLERKGLMFTSLKLYQTRDDSIGGGNILTGAKNGDILKIDQEVTPVAMEERNLAAFRNTNEKWAASSRSKTFSEAAVTGGQQLSRTPLGVVENQVAQVEGYYKQKRDNFAGFIKGLVVTRIFPSFKSDTQKEHTLTFLGSDKDISKLDKAIVQAKTDRAVVDYANKTGFFPSTIQLEDLQVKVEEKLNRQRNRYLKIPASFWDNAKYDVRILVTGESMDAGGKSQTLQMALQTIGANPGILQNETTRTIFFELLSLGGVSPADLNIDLSNVDQTPVQAGGSVAAPVQQGPTTTQSAQVV